MRRQEAEAVCPTVVTLMQDPGVEAGAFEPVVASMEQVLPRVEIVTPGLAFLPVGGAVRYYGSEAALVERIAEGLAEVGGSGALFGLAHGPFAAHQAAMQAREGAPYIVSDEAGFLASLDIGAIDREELADTFRWLGITTLGELARLPRAAVASRFGLLGISAHEQASGEDRALAPRRIPEDAGVEDKFEEPLVNLEQAGFVSRRLAHELLDPLRIQGVAPHRVEIEGEAVDGTVLRRIWRSADPFDEPNLAERIRWQLRAWVESGGIGGGLCRLRIAPADVSGEGRQLGLAEDAVREAEATRALIRAQSLLGPDAVLQAQRQGGRDPADQVQWFRWGESKPVPAHDPTAPWPGKLPAPAPALVPPRSTPVNVEWDEGLPARVRLRSRWEPVLSWAGPWRRMGRWWEGESSGDRYQIVTSAGAFLCEVREEQTYLVGIYD